MSISYAVFCLKKKRTNMTVPSHDTLEFEFATQFNLPIREVVRTGGGEPLPSVTDDGFFFNDTATTEIYTLSLHDALPTSSYTRSHTSRCLPESCQMIAWYAFGANDSMA